ncbi:MAG: uncharacterized protein KVP18_000832 [Porospora cf. gigantea A]|uniref:uncharacterized protein n=1 Tax=Porospora cf. gigantea A TaxID=2853593 RepID=UPI003559B7BC|nr:MAG: hypothetical protein KVP18_000832 [Porospora cf. gigantea A]
MNLLWRRASAQAKAGANVNFVEATADRVFVRFFSRSLGRSVSRHLTEDRFAVLFGDVQLWRSPHTLAIGVAIFSHYGRGVVCHKLAVKPEYRRHNVDSILVLLGCAFGLDALQSKKVTLHVSRRSTFPRALTRVSVRLRLGLGGANSMDHAALLRFRREEINNASR